MGTAWPKSGGYEFNNAGTLQSGCLAYFFLAGTSTPFTTYQDGDETTPHAHPVAADGVRWPAVFIPFTDGYKLVIKTSGGTTLFTQDDIPNPEPFDETFEVDENAQLNTGDIFISLKNGTRTGAVRMNGRTIGSAASAATERANADCADLFAFLWDNVANGQAAVSGGRGASAAADFAANKTIAIPDWRGASIAGLDDMGNSAASLLGSAPVVSGSTILAGSILGANTHTLLTAQLPVTTPAGTINQVTGTITQSPITPAGTITQSPITPAGSIDISGLGANFAYNSVTSIPGGGANSATGESSGASNRSNIAITGTATFTGTPQTLTFAGTPQTLTFVGSTPTFTGTSFGSGSAHNILSRSGLVTFYMKL